MKRVLIFLLALMAWPLPAMAALTIQITGGTEGALPIAVVPFGWQGSQPLSEDVAGIVAADLRRSGQFKPLDPGAMLAKPTSGDQVDFRDWRVLGMENLVVGDIRASAPGLFEVRFQLYDVYRGAQLIGYSIPTSGRDLRMVAHHIADLIYETLTGTPGAFATRIAYVTVVKGRDGKEEIGLRIADADGADPQSIMSSREPIMSPSWSPDGRRLAYVSFEDGRPAIWVQEVLTGKRDKVSAFQGINGAPAWSPDGRYLALTLSRDGNPDIYVLDLTSRQLRPLVRHPAVDTEPAWSPDGRMLVFTSDRGGTPQIYQVAAGGGEARRITYEGDYNARASFAPDSKSLTLITRVAGNYRIGVLDLAGNRLDVVSDGNLDESPSFAPNGAMIIYATRVGRKGVLAVTSRDGRVKQRLTLDEGDIRDAVWSPYFQRERKR